MVSNYSTSKVQYFILSTLLFPEDVGLGIRHQLFQQSDLGRIYRSIPFKELADLFRGSRSSSHLGRKPFFSIEGGLGLMFLKHYSQLSDEQLIERLNADWQMQMFCGIQLGITRTIRDKDIVGRWRRFFAERMEIDQLQDILAEHWSGFMKSKQVLMNDVTCYESYIKYPTDAKLLYDCSVWLFKQIDILCEKYGIKKPRSKYKNQKNKQVRYQMRKRKTYKHRRKRQRELLYWVDRGQELLQSILDMGSPIHDALSASFYDRLKVIRTVLNQQQYMYDHRINSVPGRIVSLYKPYLRPIVRGKENKRVEFGAKVHISQVDQINFIEHLSFEAFHEGVRMWKSIHKHRRRFGKCRQYAADRIYANNKNRRYCTQNKIHTNFKRKGRPSRDEDQREKMRSILGRARSTLLEGSFGNEKNHYLLRKIKARLEKTEIAWIFFGIHTANAVKMAKRMFPEEKVPDNYVQRRLIA